MHRSVPELWRETSRDMADRIMHNDQGGQYETEKNRQRASERAQKVPLRPAACRKMSVASGCVVIAAIRAHRPLDHEHHEHESKHDAGDLRSISQAVAVEPGVVNDDSERTYAEEFYRAKIAQRLHQGERNASGKRWPRERQGNLSEGCYGGPAERAAHFDHAHRLHKEARPRGDVDVRMEHQCS